MTRYSQRHCLLLGLIFLAAGVTSADEKGPNGSSGAPTGSPRAAEPALGDKVLLRILYHRGDVIESDTVFTITAETEGSSEGITRILGDTSWTSHRKLRDEVVAIGGHLNLRRHYLVERQTSAGPQGKKQVISPLQGKTVVSVLDAERPHLGSTSGKLSAAAQTEALREMPSGKKSTFPKTPVGPGDEWDVEPAMALRQFGSPQEGITKVKAHYRFEGFAQYDGQRCAQLQLQLIREGHKNGATIRYELEGPCYESLETNQELSFNVSGPVTVSSSLRRQGHLFAFHSQGQARIHTRTRVLKLAGEPLVHPDATPPTGAPQQSAPKP